MTKQRPRSHVLETESRKAFEAILPDEWTYDVPNPDYGYDYSVYPFDDFGSSGRLIRVQIKATQSSVPKNNSLRIRLKLSDLKEFDQADYPVLLVFYHSPRRILRGVWMNDYLGFHPPLKPDQETVSITLLEQHTLTTEYLRSLPLSTLSEYPHAVSVTTPATDPRLLELHQTVIHHLSSLTGKPVFADNRLPQSVCVNYHRTTDGVVRWNISSSPQSLHAKRDKQWETQPINLSKLQPHLRNPFPDFTSVPESLVEILYVLSHLLCPVDPISSIRSIGKLFTDYNGPFKVSDFLLDTILYVREVGYSPVILSFFEKLLNSPDREWTWLPHLAIFGDRSWFSQENVVNGELPNQRLRRIQFETEPDDTSRAYCAYNLANSLHNSHLHRPALRYYFLARRLEPDYLTRHYWWDEVGTSLYNCRKYTWAKHCYSVALFLSPKGDPRYYLYAWIADCCLMKGQFGEARDFIETYFSLESEPKPEFLLKLSVVEMLVEMFGEVCLRKQYTPELHAERIGMTESDEESVALFFRCLEADPLNTTAWFNYGLRMSQAGLFQNALNGFLICAVVNPFDEESWFNALLVAFTANEDKVFLLIYDSMLATFGKKVYAYISERVVNGDEFPGEIKENFIKFLGQLEECRESCRQWIVRSTDDKQPKKDQI